MIDIVWIKYWLNESYYSTIASYCRVHFILHFLNSPSNLEGSLFFGLLLLRDCSLYHWIVVGSLTLRLNIVELFLQFLYSICNAFWSLLFSAVSSRHWFSAIKRTDDHLNKFFVIVEWGEVILRIEFWMCLCIFFEANNTLLIAFIFGKKLINFLQLLILFIWLWPASSSPFRHSHIQSSYKITDPFILTIKTSTCSLIMFPNFWSNTFTYFDNDSFDCIGCWIFRSYSLSISFFLRKI